MKKMNIAIVGLGLIGGSLAKAVKKNTEHNVIGIDIKEEVLSFAKSVGAIDEKGNIDDLKKADVVIICLYPDLVANFVLENKGKFKKGAIVTDAAGIKSKICAELYNHDFDFTFVGGHPMAGREVTGFENSLDDLFDGASYIFTPKKEDDALAVLKQLAEEIGFAKCVVTTPEHHDEVIAYTSQIAHVLACAYVLSPRSRQHHGFSAGSFRDVSRVAKINETLWSQLFIDNSPALCSEIDTLVKNLEQIKEYIEKSDAEKLSEILRHGRIIKEEIDK